MLTRATYSEARGLRNNNPLNIIETDRIDYDWKGEALIDLDDQFEVFVSPEYGIRAAGKILDNYRKKGFVTVAAIINRWAPRHENNTDSYIKNIESRTGWASTFKPDRSHYPRLLAAMIQHENGFNPFNLEFIQDSLEIA